jgi:hypothetical protein
MCAERGISIDVEKLENWRSPGHPRRAVGHDLRRGKKG